MQARTYAMPSCVWQPLCEGRSCVSPEQAVSLPAGQTSTRNLPGGMDALTART